MDHPLHTITYVADIDRVLVIMAHVHPPSPASPTAHSADNGVGGTPQEGEGEEEAETKYIPKMTCHVLDTSNVSRKAEKWRFAPG